MKTDKDVKMPVCPYCCKEMVITVYKGYYDSFTYWECQCDESALNKKATNIWRGSYA